MRAILLFAVASAMALPSNVTEIIRAAGYPCEDYVAQTPDGYLLSLQRIPHSPSSQSASKGVVLFQHGLLDNANGIVMLPPGKGLPYMLSDAGFDVWLGNNRGNGYSMNNVNYGPDTDQFWAFSFDEMGKYDLPTMVDFVLETTGAETLSYIGHSEGTTQAFAGLVDSAELGSKMNIFVALAPVTFAGHVRSQILVELAKFNAAEIIFALGQREFYLAQAIHEILPFICTLDPSVCNDVLEAFMGPSNNTDPSIVPYVLNYEPNPTSVQNMIHWSQMVTTNQFQMFDYGSSQENMEHYNSTVPPVYHLSDLPSTPIAIFHGGNDYLADPTDVAALLAALPNPPVLVNYQPSYSHTDFLWAFDAYQLIYPQVVSLCEKYSQ